MDISCLLFFFFSPNSTQPNSITSHNTNQTQNKDLGSDKVGILKTTQTQSKELGDKVGVLKPNETVILFPNSPVVVNQTVDYAPKSSVGGKIVSGNGDKKIAETGLLTNETISLPKREENDTSSGVLANVESEKLVEKLMNCDLFHGEWVRDDSYPLYKPGSCSFIDEQFNCFLNGRPDKGFQQLKWKPRDCTLPRLDGSRMLELLRGKRLVFVGDSLNRNMWESLICILRNSVKDQSQVYEASGQLHFRSGAFYSFIFKNYNCTVEFFVSPFLVQEWEVPQNNGSNKETLRLDKIGTSADKYKVQMF